MNQINPSRKRKKVFPFEMASPTELAWLAGLFQAEAYFYVDARVRSKSQDPSYKPPPRSPGIRIEMIEEDVIDYVGKLVDQKTKLQVRKTSADNRIYRITIEAREKVHALLQCLLPYTIGEKTRTKILNHLTLCQEYDTWVQEGGRRQHAQQAARASAKKRKELQNEK